MDTGDGDTFTAKIKRRAVPGCDRGFDRAELEQVGRLITLFRLPVYYMRGNHDCDNFTAHDFYAISGLAEPPFCR